MESGIDLNFDLSALSADDFDLDYSDFEEVIGTLKNQEYYELKSKTVPETERLVKWRRTGNVVIFIRSHVNTYDTNERRQIQIYRRFVN